MNCGEDEKTNRHFSMGGMPGRLEHPTPQKYASNYAQSVISDGWVCSSLPEALDVIDVTNSQACQSYYAKI